MPTEKQKRDRYFIKTYGCQMNINDSNKMIEILESRGYQPSEIGKAHIIIINSCTVRQNAENKAFWYAKSVQHYKKNKPYIKIVFCGCVAEDKKDEIQKLLPHVDLFIPPNNPGKIEEVLEGGNRRMRVEGRGGVTAFVNIMTGCDNFCSYCIVPYVRGREKSRRPEEILAEIRALPTNVKEITLLGQNVNSYKYGFAALLRKIKGVERIRFLTSHPKDMSDDIIEAVAKLPNVCEHIHLPIQHGDDDILKAMNRKYTVDDFKRTVEKIRNKIPGVAITSDMIIGFPGETEKQFENCVRTARELSFDSIITTIFSPRPKTTAAKMDNQVPEKTKKERLQKIMKVVDEIALSINEKLVGTTQEILVEDFMNSEYMGRTRTNKIVKFKSAKSGLRGKLLNVTIKSARSFILKGDL
ncbi:MAG: tRNA (N6-isopentenyl adenosine(37)-C2)-methylthiotransferase MiaB [Candidatus Saganbacteria bacterium]|nr:tRNA (N6-isopentenyl adenosine(37)-C2)-methylthiotransferase MiaB [Candidatus Saganbacteria bacterium]